MLGYSLGKLTRGKFSTETGPRAFHLRGSWGISQLKCEHLCKGEPGALHRRRVGGCRGQLSTTPPADTELGNSHTGVEIGLVGNAPNEN